MSRALKFKNNDYLDTSSIVHNKNKLSDIIYPIGSIYLSINSTNPSTFFGGTWEQITNRFLLAAGSSYSAGSTGGEATHTLTVNEMPNHNHKHRQWIFNGASSSGTHYGMNFAGSNGEVWDNESIGSGEVPFGNFATGGGKAHNNMPPYLAVYIWKRIS